MLDRLQLIIKADANKLFPGSHESPTISIFQNQVQHPMDSLFGKHWHTLAKQVDIAQDDHPDPWVTAWLQDQGSLTKRIQQVCTQGFNVGVLTHQFIVAPESALDSLQLNTGDRVLHREVLLCDGGEPLVFACSLLPEKALQGRFAALCNMGSQPLGHWIFKEPALQRGTMQITHLQGDSELFERLTLYKADRPGRLWGRKTLFTGAKHPFLVSEFFLHALKFRTGKLNLNGI